MEKKFMISIFYILVLLTVLGIVKSNESPEIARKDCSFTDRERAIEELINNGFVDHVTFAKFTINPGNGVLRVKQTINNMAVTGLSTAVRTVQADLKAGTIFLTYEIKRVTTHLDYELDGYCLLLRIWGKGKGVVIMDDVKVTARATVKTVRDKLKITSMKITFDISDGSFELSSLFGESQPGFLTPLYVKAFNANSRYIFNEILPSYIPHSEEVLASAWGLVLEKVQNHQDK